MFSLNQVSAGFSQTIVMEFNMECGYHIILDTVAKFTSKFQNIGSVTDQPKCGRPRRKKNRRRQK